MKKKIFCMFVLLLAMLAFTGCTEEAADIGPEIPVGVSGIAGIGRNDVEIVSYRIINDNLLLVRFEWTNRDTHPTRFTGLALNSLFQNGMALSISETFVPGIDRGGVYSSRNTIQPGHSQTVKMLFELRDGTSPITFELGSPPNQLTHTIHLDGSDIPAYVAQPTPIIPGDVNSPLLGTWILESSTTFEVFQSGATVEFFADGRGTSSCAGGFSWEMFEPEFPGPDMLSITFDEHLHMEFYIMEYPIINNLHLEGWAWGERYEYVFRRVK